MNKKITLKDIAFFFLFNLLTASFLFADVTINQDTIGINGNNGIAGANGNDSNDGNKDGEPGSKGGDGLNGGIAITPTENLINNAEITGGRGGIGGTGGTGGRGDDDTDGGDGTNGASGGQGGNSGASGTGIELHENNLLIINNKKIIGGAGNNGGTGGAGGRGGNGSSVPQFGIVGDGGNGGPGGSGGMGGTGAIGLSITSNGAQIINKSNSLITGGSGGVGGTGGTGGAGGQGGSGGGTGGRGGNGGQGGVGGNGSAAIYLSGDNCRIINEQDGQIQGGDAGNGGNGGNGGAGGPAHGEEPSPGGLGGLFGGISGQNSSGNGGTGGFPGSFGRSTSSIVLEGDGVSIINKGTITAGNGGFIGAAGIQSSGSNLTVINAGLISGSLSSRFNAGGNALQFGGNGNRLELQQGYSFIGKIVGAGNDTLTLGGDISPSSAFDVSLIGSLFTGFSIFTKIGESNWTLSNTTVQITPWTITEGILLINSDENLGTSSTALTLNGGILSTNNAFTLNRPLKLNVPGGTIQAALDLTLNNELSGDGPLEKTGPGIFILSRDSNEYTGNIKISEGTLKLKSINAAGTGGITTTDTTLDLSIPVGGNLTNSIKGNGNITIPSIVTNPLNLTGDNTEFLGKWLISGKISASSMNNLGSATIQIYNTGQLMLNPNIAMLFTSPLIGNGTLTAQMANVIDDFNFNNTVGNEFEGTVELKKGTFDLSGINTQTLLKSTLSIGEENTTIVGNGAQSIGNLTMNGGTLVFNVDVPAAPVSPMTITTNKLTISSGRIKVQVPNPLIPPANWDAAGNTTLLQQDDTIVTQLMSFTEPIGSLSTLQLVDQNDIVITPEDPIFIRQGNTNVAVGKYAYGLVMQNQGLYVSYGLRELTLLDNTSLNLTGDNPALGASESVSKLTGQGNIIISPNEIISLNNVHNDYTGTTTITSKTVTLGSDSALGKTSDLIVNANAILDVNGTTQSIGAIHPSGIIDLNRGSLTISNGGETYSNSLMGEGILTTTGGFLNIDGANPGLNANVTIDQPATISLNDLTGLGSSTITDLGTLQLSGVKGTLSNMISGDGAVQIKDSSNIVLDSENPGFSGNIAIDAESTLNATRSSFFGTADINNAGHFVAETNKGNWALTNLITGTGDFKKTGSNILQIPVAQLYTGNTILSSGITSLIGSLDHSTTFINNGATLKGNGSVKELINEGTIAPGNSIGTLTVNQNYSMTNNSRYECEINSAGASDLIKVLAGTATLDGNLEVVSLSQQYPAYQVYTILTAPLVRGKFSSHSYSDNYMQYNVIYNTDSVQIELYPQFSGRIPTTGNSYIVSRYLDSLVPTPNSGLQSLYTSLNNLPFDKLKIALNELSPASYTQVSTLISNTELDHMDSFMTRTSMDRLVQECGQKAMQLTKQFSSFKQRFLNLFSSEFHQKKAKLSSKEMSNLKHYPTSTCINFDKTTFWIQGASRSFSQDNILDPSSLYIQGLDGNSYDTSVGLDWVLTSDFKVGITAGYTHNHYKMKINKDKGNINTLRFGVYGLWEPITHWYINGSVNYGHHRFKSERIMTIIPAVANNKHKGNHISGLIETGYDFGFGKSTTLTPYVGGGIFHLQEDKYKETGAYEQNMAIKSRHSTVLQGKGGVQISHLWNLNEETSIYGFMRLGTLYRSAIHKKQKVSASLASQDGQFTVVTKNRKNLILNPSIGFTASMNQQVSATVSYEDEISSRQRAQQVMLRVNLLL